MNSSIHSPLFSNAPNTSTEITSSTGKFIQKTSSSSTDKLSYVIGWFRFRKTFITQSLKNRIELDSTIMLLLDRYSLNMPPLENRPIPSNPKMFTAQFNPLSMSTAKNLFSLYWSCSKIKPNTLKTSPPSFSPKIILCWIMLN
jgi:hypothetical protein